MSARIEYRNGYYYITVPAAEALQDDNLSRFLDSGMVRHDFSRPESPSELGDSEVRRWNEEMGSYGDSDLF
jgi:hypothetical protein